MKLYLLCSGIAFCYLWAMINDDHLPKINSNTAYANVIADTNAGSAAVVDETVLLGEKLFKKHCNACHNRNMVDDLTGPALKGVSERWADYPRADLYAWIRNSQKMIQEGHPKATVLYKEWNKTVMTSFDLEDKEIEAVLVYVEAIADAVY